MDTPKKLILEQFIIGPMDNYNYFIGCVDTKEIAVVDAAWDAEEICSKADKMAYKIKALIFTHGHPDHINALHDMLGLLGDIPVYISDSGRTKDSLNINNLVLCKDHSQIKIGNISIECIHTPGHTPGSQCFLYKNILITGDTLFINGCGRTDLPGGNFEEMYNSLYNIIMKLPDETIIYPGHRYDAMPFDTIENQKKTNHFLTCKNMDEFISERM